MFNDKWKKIYNNLTKLQLVSKKVYSLVARKNQDQCNVNNPGHKLKLKRNGIV